MTSGARDVRLLRTVRFDASDTFVFDPAAEPGEWAVSGAFAFADMSPGALTGKPRQAFANAFLGTDSFGWSTFASVVTATRADRDALIERLAGHFVETYGAPSIEAARPVAAGEVDFIAGLVAEAPINTLFTVRRTFDEAGEIREEFRTIQPPDGEPRHARIWSIEHDDTDAR